MDSQVEITVKKDADRVTVVCRLPASLDVLSPPEQERVIESAMWRAAESVGGFLDRERTTGSTQRVTAVIAA